MNQLTVTETVDVEKATTQGEIVEAVNETGKGAGIAEVENAVGDDEVAEVAAELGAEAEEKVEGIDLKVDKQQ